MTDKPLSKMTDITVLKVMKHLLVITEYFTCSDPIWYLLFRCKTMIYMQYAVLGRYRDVTVDV